MVRKKPIGAYEWLKPNHPGMGMDDFLMEHFVTKGLSVQEIADPTGTDPSGWQFHIEKLGLSQSLIRLRMNRWMSEHRESSNSLNSGEKHKPLGALEWLKVHCPGVSMREFLIEYYVNEGLSGREIAEMTGTGLRGWYYYIKSFGLSRSMSEAREKFWRSDRGRKIKDKAFRRVWTDWNEERCQLTGVQRKWLKHSQGDRCLICNAPLERYLTRIHHVKAVVLGGEDELHNLVALCYNCHDHVHLGDIETVVRLRQRFYRCFFCHRSIYGREIRVFRTTVETKGKPDGTVFSCLSCSTCFELVTTGDDVCTLKVDEICRPKRKK
ncbi:HNH endonuclease [Candidatus Sumerlaeota bacterium]|nr:HNH endonuclease [Candidatus Sumerlaeota bacterium]